MMQIKSEEELLNCFRDLDRNEVELLADIRYPLTIDNYHSWTESSGHRIYLLFENINGGLPKGIVFRRTSAGGSDVPEMCSWCHSVRGHGSVSLLTANSNKHRRVGLYLCRDLSCKDKSFEIPHPNDLNDGLSGEDKIHKIMERISNFAYNVLF